MKNKISVCIVVSLLILSITLAKGVIFGIGDYDFIFIVIPILVMLPLGILLIVSLYYEDKQKERQIE